METKTSYVANRIKKILLLITVVPSFLLNAQTENSKGTAFTQNILYKQQLLGNNLIEVRKAWWHNRLEPTVQQTFISPILFKAKNNKVKVFSPFEPFKDELDYGDVHRKLFEVDSVAMFNSEESLETGIPVMVMQPYEIFADKISFTQFNENWKYDAEKMTFEKTVKGIILFKEKEDEPGFKNEFALFYMPFSQPKDNAEKSQLPLLTDRITYDVRIKNLYELRDTVRYAYTAMADGVKTEVENTDTVRTIYDIDGNEIVQTVKILDKIKYVDKDGYEIRFEKDKTDTVQYPRGLNPSNIKSIINSLYQPAITGKLTAYAPVYPYNKPLTKEELKKITTNIDTAYRFNKYSYSQLDTFISKGTLTEDQVTSIRFYESWFYDSTKTILYKKVNGVSLLRDIIGKDADEWASKELFYIPFNGSEKENPIQKNTSVASACINYPTTFDSTGTLKKITGVDSVSIMKFSKNLLENISTGGGIADMSFIWSYPYDDWSPYDLSFQDAQKILNPYEIIMEGPEGTFDGKQYSGDTLIQTQDDGSYTISVKRPITEKSITGFAFVEDWRFDSENFSFTKTVRGILPEKIIRKEMANITYIKPLFYIPFSPDNNATYLHLTGNETFKLPDYNTIAKPEYLLGENVFYYATINLDDYSGDGVIVSSQPMWQENLDYSKREAIVKKLIDLTLSGKIKAYSPETSKKMSVDEFKKRMVKQVTNEEKTETVPMQYYDISSLGFEETWYAEPKTRIFYKKVKKIYLATSTKDNETGVVKYTPIAWFQMK